jgi:hypothetical protein
MRRRESKEKEDVIKNYKKRKRNLRTLKKVLEKEEEN